MNPLPILVLTALWRSSSFPLPVLVLTAFWLYSPLPLRIIFLGALWLFSRRKRQTPHKPPLSTATSERATPGTDTIDTGSGMGFDVFLNFRGPDSRHTVADVLYKSQTHAGFRVFLDNEEIRKGEVIEGELLRAITNSSIYIPIFSKDYASSRWCLRELAKMIDCLETSSSDTKKVILPIFYDVDVSKDVKLRSQVYTTALQKHKDELGEVIVQPWEDALRKVARIKGWNLKDHGLTELRDLINKEVFSKLTTSEAVPSVPDRLVGIDKPVEDIMKLLEEGSPDVRFIVIHGMGGIGKTTLADVVFKKISSRFQSNCFLKDVRRSSSDPNMVKLQEKLLIDTLNLKFIKVSNVDDGIDMISKRLRHQNVLIVLDDVDEIDHLRKLAAKSYWFGAKSRILVTTRNIEFLQNTDDREYSFYAMKEMNRPDALILFCRHAFEEDWPRPDYHDISTEIVATTGGLPLALQVIGSSLYNRDKETWKFRLEKLREVPHKDVQETLMISYQALEYEQKQIFLDAACLFNGKKMTDPIYFWEACKLYPKSVIKILVQRSMIKVYGDDKLWMHDQLRDIGRAIAQPKMPGLESQFLAKPSRLWSPEYALDALWKKEVDKSITALELGKLDAGCCFAREEFARADGLKFLKLQGGNFEGDFKYVFQQLRWLSWSDCPLRFEATNLSFKNLVVLKISRSQITENWGGWGVFMEAKHLKAIHLKDCKRLKKSPDFSTFLRLERLILRECSGLEEIDGSINKLKHLNYLEISNRDVHYGQHLPEVPAQSQLLPDTLGGLRSLEELKIESARLTELHPSIGELLCLKLLCLRCPQLENLPSSIGKLMSLTKLDFSYSRIKELPDGIGDLKWLNNLNMAHSALEYLPDTIGRLESLEELDLSDTEITQLPETIGNLKRLTVMNVSSSKIKKLPMALVELENLQRLWAYSCGQLDGELPEEIGKLSCLAFVDLEDTTIRRVPTTINQLSQLKAINLGGITEFQELSKLPTSLISLSVTSSSLQSHQVPDLSNMTNLDSLVLSCGCGFADNSDWTFSPCIQTPHMKWLLRLSKLQELKLDLADFISPPTELSSLSHLQSLEITCFDLRPLTHLPSSLENLRLNYVKSPIEWQLFSSLNNLTDLTLNKFWLKEIKVDCLEHLLALRLSNCKFLERLSIPSSLKKLKQLRIQNCPRLVDTDGLGQLKSLVFLQFYRCASIQRLPDLSGLKKLHILGFEYCESLESIPDMDDEAQCRIELINCKNFRDFDGPYSERHHDILT